MTELLLLTSVLLNFFFFEIFEFYHPPITFSIALPLPLPLPVCIRTLFNVKSIPI